MIEIEKFQIEDFAKSQFPGKAYYIGKGWFFIQAGKCLGANLHYEYMCADDAVALHIEGRNWRGIRNYLHNHVFDNRLSNLHWGRNHCMWKLNTSVHTWKEIQDAFVLLASIMEPHIANFEKTISQQEEENALPITAEFISLKNCFEKNLKIPEYQRPYRWDVKNVEQLLNDIKNSRDNGKQTYLIGSVILHKEETEYNVVDGQQRITSILLLLKCLEYTGVLPNLRYNHTDSFSHIKENYDCIKRWLTCNISDRQEFAQYIANNCVFVEIVVTELGEAFQMFESQNGRGKELEAYNLLKAYHIRAMASASQEAKIECDKHWEDATMYFFNKGSRKDLLLQLFNEQLYRTRLWSRGDDAFSFGKKNVDEFKGVTLDKEHSLDFSYQNILIQQELATQMMKNLNMNLFKVKGRFLHGDNDEMNPFVSITQLILNGKAFFEYVGTYVEIYKRLFLQLDTSQMQEFKSFYKRHCHYAGHNQRLGDGYTREVYKSAIMYVFDRFGEVGVNSTYRELFMCIYRHRLEKKQVRYATMAKKENTAWIFKTIHNAKNIADLNVIKRVALEVKHNFDSTEPAYKIDEVLSVYKEY